MRSSNFLVTDVKSLHLLEKKQKIMKVTKCYSKKSLRHVSTNSSVLTIAKSSHFLKRMFINAYKFLDIQMKYFMGRNFGIQVDELGQSIFIFSYCSAALTHSHALKIPHTLLHRAEKWTLLVETCQVAQ